MDSRTMRRRFFSGLFTGLGVVWPILSGLVALIAVLGLIVGLIERWSVQESIYFAFVTGLTIGYGDFAPGSLASRALDQRRRRNLSLAGDSGYFEACAADVLSRRRFSIMR